MLFEIIKVIFIVVNFNSVITKKLIYFFIQGLKIKISLYFKKYKYKKKIFYFIKNSLTLQLNF